MFEPILTVVFKWQKELEKNQGEDETHLSCFILLVTSVAAGNVFGGEVDDRGKKGGI